MASASPRASLPNCQGRDAEPTEQLHKLPELQSSKTSLRPPVYVHDLQAVLKRRVKRKEPSLRHWKICEQLYFPGWYTRSTPSGETDQPQRPCGQLPVHLLHLPPINKNVPSIRSLFRRPSPAQRCGHLDEPSKDKISQLSKHSCVVTHDGDVFTKFEGRYYLETRKDLEKEDQQFRKLMSIPFFANFKKWKYFHLWHVKVRKKKIHLARESLRKNLFIVNQYLGAALIEIRKMCSQISDTDLFHVEKKHTYSLHTFRDIQLKQLQEFLSDFKKFQVLVKEVVIHASENYWSDIQSKCVSDSWKVSLRGTFHSSRLICFIRLVDFLVISTLQHVLVNAVTKLLSKVCEQVCQTPSHDVIQSWGRHAEPGSKTADEEKRRRNSRSETSGLQPMFITELVLDVNTLTYKPSEEDFLDMVTEIFGQLEETVTSLSTLSVDPDCVEVAQLPLVKKHTSRYERNPLKTCIDSDGHLQRVARNIKELLQIAFETAKEYSHTLEHFQLFYKDNEGLDLNVMQQNHGNSFTFIEQALKLYHSQHKEAVAIQQEKHLGLLLVNQTKFKEKLVSSPLRCLEVINEMLTRLAKERCDALTDEACTARFKLKYIPSTTAELADSLTFLDEIEERVVVILNEQETVSEMYDLINTYSGPLPLDDLIDCRTLELEFDDLLTAIYKAGLERGPKTDRFCRSLHEDIEQLNQKVMETHLMSQDPHFSDINADSSQVRRQLGKIQILIDELQKQASTFTSYQKKFKMELTKFDTLEELTTDFRLKQLLWESREEWDSLQEGWKQSTLQHLDLEHFSAQVNKYSKYVHQLEKGLPCNEVVARLKDKVEVTKQKLPVITDLRNPCMKPGHWKSLESIVGTTLNVEELTVAVMEEMNIFSFSSEIQEVSGKASGEASVENLVTKLTMLNSEKRETAMDNPDDV